MKTLKVILLLFVFASPCVAQQITFAWDAHPESAVITGFKLYQSKQAGTFDAVPVGTFIGGTLTTGSIPKPTSPGRYYWVLRAYMPDPAGGDIESGDSNMVTDVIKPKEPTGFVRGVLAAVAYVPARIGEAVRQAFVPQKNLRILK